MRLRFENVLKPPKRGEGAGEMSESLMDFMGVALRENWGGGVIVAELDNAGTRGRIFRMSMISRGSREARGVEWWRMKRVE